MSHPSWVCGLKLIKKILCPVMAVTPFVGVWIETFGQCQKNTLGRVTPFVGVWIETELMF